LGFSDPKSPAKVGRAVSPSGRIVHQLSDHLCCRQITLHQKRAVQSRITACLRRNRLEFSSARGKKNGRTPAPPKNEPDGKAQRTNQLSRAASGDAAAASPANARRLNCSPRSSHYQAHLQRLPEIA